jgi:hypothetical protein
MRIVWRAGRQVRMQAGPVGGRRDGCNRHSPPDSRAGAVNGMHVQRQRRLASDDGGELSLQKNQHVANRCGNAICVVRVIDTPSNGLPNQLCGHRALLLRIRRIIRMRGVDDVGVRAIQPWHKAYFAGCRHAPFAVASGR